MPVSTAETSIRAIGYLGRMDPGKPQIPVIEPDGHVRPFDQIMDEVLTIAVEHYGGNVAAIAEHLKVARSTIYNRLERRQKRSLLA